MMNGCKIRVVSRPKLFIFVTARDGSTSVGNVMSGAESTSPHIQLSTVSGGGPRVEVESKVVSCAVLLPE